MSEQLHESVLPSTEELLRASFGCMMRMARAKLGREPYLEIDHEPEVFSTSLGRLSVLNVLESVRVEIEEQTTVRQRFPLRIVAEMSLTQGAANIDLERPRGLRVITAGAPTGFIDEYTPKRWDDNGYSLESRQGQGSLPYKRVVDLANLVHDACGEVAGQLPQPLNLIR
jgi:hypothetical protein